MNALRLLIVDDEPLACTRLATLLQKIQQPAAEICASASTAAQAHQMLLEMQPDVILLDIHMPEMDGMQWARKLHAQGLSCQIIFVTASNEHALDAFEVAATDYLTKPVRLERLQDALHKAKTRLAAQRKFIDTSKNDVLETLVIQERGQIQRILVVDILFARAESKYVKLHLRQNRNLLWDGSLSQLEEKYPDYFLRTHRSILIYKKALRQLKHCALADGSESWLVQLHGCSDRLPVSRRQLASVRAALNT